MTVALEDAKRTPENPPQKPLRGSDRKGHRLIFANQLRGLASFSVMLTHLIGVYWAGKQVVAAATSSPPQPGGFPRLFWLVAHHWFNFGPFGVAIFFLISGLVIPISLGTHSRLSFLIARILRVYPTYIAAFTVNLIVIWAASRYWHLPFVYPPHTLHGDILLIGSNALLLQDFFGQPYIDMVSWTLCIELKFYLLMAFLAPAIRSGNVAILFAIAAGALAFNLAANTYLLSPLAAVWPSVMNVMLQESVYVVFMLIGVLFNYRLHKLISPLGLLTSVGGLLLLFIACWRTSAVGNQYPVVPVNYVYALALFGLLFMVRRWVKETRPLSALAAISFPFYLVHAVVGYSLLKVLMLSAGLRYTAALTITIPVLLALASLIHISVERRSIALGKRFTTLKSYGSGSASSILTPSSSKSLGSH